MYFVRFNIMYYRGNQLLETPTQTALQNLIICLEYCECTVPIEGQGGNVTQMYFVARFGF